MAVRAILLYPEREAALRRKSKPVRTVDQQVRTLVEDLKDTLMEHRSGVGLAAPQINVHQRVVIVRVSHESEWNVIGNPIALINPRIIEARDERRDFDGCLSIPELYGRTTRPHYLIVSALDEQGMSVRFVLEDFDAVVAHHEIDHLNGVLFIDRIERPEDLYRIQADEPALFSGSAF